MTGLRHVGEILPSILRRVEADKMAELRIANEARRAGIATERQLDLLQAVRDRHGAGPLLDRDGSPIKRSREAA